MFCVCLVLLQRCTTRLQKPVGDFAVALVEDKQGWEASELKDHVHALVFELHRTAPDYMLYIFPRLVDYLEVVFSPPHTHHHHHHHQPNTADSPPP